MDRKKHLKLLSEALGMSYSTLISADVKCFINEFLSDVEISAVRIVDEKLLHFTYSFKKPIYVLTRSGKNETLKTVIFMVYDNKTSHIKFLDETLNLKKLIRVEYGIKAGDIDELLRLPLKRFFKSIDHPQIRIGYKKIKFIN